MCANEWEGSIRTYDDDGYGVDVLHDVVGDAVEVHLSGLGDEVVEHLAVDAPVDGVEEEDLESSS